MCKIVTKLSKMHQEIHKKSLLYTLQENKSKEKKTTRLLLFFMLLVAIFLLFLAFYTAEWYALVFIIISISLTIFCFSIFKFWSTQKKIKDELNKL